VQEGTAFYRYQATTAPDGGVRLCLKEASAM
jgi:hypothetical protein